MAEFTDFGIVVAIFLAGSLIVGSLMWKLVQRSGRRLIVAGRSFPCFWWEQCWQPNQLMETHH
jgi:hypothetical protein